MPYSYAFQEREENVHVAASGQPSGQRSPYAKPTYSHVCTYSEKNTSARNPQDPPSNSLRTATFAGLLQEKNTESARNPPPANTLVSVTLAGFRSPSGMGLNPSTTQPAPSFSFPKINPSPLAPTVGVTVTSWVSAFGDGRERRAKKRQRWQRGVGAWRRHPRRSSGDM